MYRDGIQRVQDVDDGTGFPGSIRFFQDYINNPVLASAGAVARIRLFEGPMTTEQVHQLDRVPETPSGDMPILFFSNRNGTTEHFRMNTNGSSQHRLTTNEFTEFAGKFSPNGQKIVYQRRESGSERSRFLVFGMFRVAALGG